MKPADHVRTKALAVLEERSPQLLGRLPNRQPVEDVVKRSRTSKTFRQPVEDVVKRSRTSKTFDLGGNTKHLSQTVGPQHYLDGSQWEEIDLAFQDRAAGLVSDKAAGIVTVFKDRIGWRHESRAGGWWAEIELIEVDGQRPKLNTPTVGETTILFPAVADGVEVEIVLLREGAEAFKNLTRPAELAWRITQSANSKARINTNPKGKDATGDTLEMVASFTEGIYRERWTGRVSKIVDPATRKKEWTDKASLPVRIDASITEDVVAGADDGTEQNGAWSPLTYPNRFGTNTSYVFHSGIRFQSLAIANTATITAATLTIKIQTDGGAIGKLYADDVDDAAAWSAGNKPSTITKTTATADINPSGTGVQSFDILTVVQEVIARSGWASGNDIRFSILRNGSGLVEFDAFEELGTGEPQLDITYTAGGGGGGTANNLLLLGVG